jgi:hypothetical protein
MRQTAWFMAWDEGTTLSGAIRLLPTLDYLHS